MHFGILVSEMFEFYLFVIAFSNLNFGNVEITLVLLTLLSLNFGDVSISAVLRALLALKLRIVETS